MSAHAAPDTRRTLEALVGLGIHPNINAHFTIRTAIATRYTHLVLDCDSKATELLDQPHDRRERTEKTAPDSTNS